MRPRRHPSPSRSPSQRRVTSCWTSTGCTAPACATASRSPPPGRKIGVAQESVARLGELPRRWSPARPGPRPEPACPGYQRREGPASSPPGAGRRRRRECSLARAPSHGHILARAGCLPGPHAVPATTQAGSPPPPRLRRSTSAKAIRPPAPPYRRPPRWPRRTSAAATGRHVLQVLHGRSRRRGSSRSRRPIPAGPPIWPMRAANTTMTRRRPAEGSTSKIGDPQWSAAQPAPAGQASAWATASSAWPV